VNNQSWNTEIIRYLALNRAERSKWMANLLFILTMHARDTYTVGGAGLDDPERMRRFNELTHRSVTQLRNQVNGRSGLPEETFVTMIGVGIEELGLKVDYVVDELKK
jgi:hypothetical protein